jgi:hypothetical protein
MMPSRPVVALLLFSAALFAFEAPATKIDYRLLATSKTSTMEKEMNDAASAGYKFSEVMGGETAFGGKETVVVMERAEPDTSGPRRYRLVATNKTSTLEKELNQAGGEGFIFKGVTVFESAFGGREVAVILERSPESSQAWSYRVLATSRTSTMNQELNHIGTEGFLLQGMCVGKTAFGGSEVVSILARPQLR